MSEERALTKDPWEEHRLAVLTEIKQLKKLLACKEDIITQHEAGRKSQLEDIRGSVVV